MEINSEYNTDKRGNVPFYDNLFADLWGKEDIRLLELGVGADMGSLLAWRDNFPHGFISGIDIGVPSQELDRIGIHKGSQDDIGLLKKVSNSDAPDGFDIIIDDASHVGALSKTSFDYLFYNSLKDGGIYVVEDWGTGYWGWWQDGGWTSPPTGFMDNRIQTHDYGMVGFIKYLIDLIGLKDATSGHGRGPLVDSHIREIRIHPGIAVVFKT